MVSNGATFDESSLVRGDQLWKDSGESGSEDFGNDFIEEIQQANRSKVSKCIRRFGFGDEG